MVNAPITRRRRRAPVAPESLPGEDVRLAVEDATLFQTPADNGLTRVSVFETPKKPQRAANVRRHNPIALEEMGRTTPFPTKLDPKLIHIAKWATRLFGVTTAQLAQLFGVDPTTIDEWMMSNADFFRAIRDAKDEFNTRSVEKSLLQRAMGYEYDEITRESTEILLPMGVPGASPSSRRRGAGNDDVSGKAQGLPHTKNNVVVVPGVKIKVTRKSIAPDITAIIFWLVNRTRKDGRWQNTQNVKIEGGLTVGRASTPDLLKNFSKDDLAALEGLAMKAGLALPAHAADDAEDPGDGV